MKIVSKNLAIDKRSEGPYRIELADCPFQASVAFLVYHQNGQWIVEPTLGHYAPSISAATNLTRSFSTLAGANSYVKNEIRLWLLARKNAIEAFLEQHGTVSLE